MPTDSKRQALRHIRRIVRENLQEACERVIRGSSALPAPDEMDDYVRGFRASGLVCGESRRKLY